MEAAAVTTVLGLREIQVAAFYGQYIVSSKTKCSPLLILRDFIPVILRFMHDSSKMNI
jgi:hypothetical protein